MLLKMLMLVLRNAADGRKHAHMWMYIRVAEMRLRMGKARCVLLCTKIRTTGVLRLLRLRRRTFRVVYNIVHLVHVHEREQILGAQEPPNLLEREVAAQTAALAGQDRADCGHGE
jgi:hypothetical protein